jgi:hypothetical protein
MTPQSHHTPEPEQSAADGSRLWWIETVRWTTDGWLVGGVGLLVVFAAFWLLGGVLGAVAWVGIAVTWLLFPPVVSVAIGHFAVLAILPSDTELTTILLTEAALLTPLLTDILGGRETDSVVDAVLFVVIVGVGGTSILVAARQGYLIATGIVLLLVVGSVSYLLHRYLLLNLGQLSEDQT